MLECSMVAFILGAVFLNRAHFDLFYHWVAIIIVFGRIANEEMSNPVLHAVRSDTGSGRGEIQAGGRRGFDRKPNRRTFRDTELLPGRV
jgi:hypothetical protein